MTEQDKEIFDYSFRIEEKPKYIIGYHQLLDELFLFNSKTHNIISSVVQVLSG